MTEQIDRRHCVVCGGESVQAQPHKLRLPLGGGKHSDPLGLCAACKLVMEEVKRTKSWASLPAGPLRDKYLRENAGGGLN